MVLFWEKSALNRGDTTERNLCPSSMISTGWESLVLVSRLYRAPPSLLSEHCLGKYQIPLPKRAAQACVASFCYLLFASVRRDGQRSGESVDGEPTAPGDEVRNWAFLAMVV